MLKKELTKELLEWIAKLNAECLDEIIKLILKAIKDSANKSASEIDTIWMNLIKLILDIIYKYLEIIYKKVLELIKKIYPKVDKIKDINIDDLTWQEDGKSIEDRITTYCQYAAEALKNNDEHIKDTLIYNMMRIIDTESITIANQMLKKRVSKIYKFGQVVGDGCPSCIPRTKKIVPVEELDWPPYHPNCCCIAVLYTEEEIMEAD